MGQALGGRVLVHPGRVLAAPAFLQIADHAHRLQHLRVAQLALQVAGGFTTGHIGRFGRGNCLPVSKPCQRCLNHSENQRENTQPGVQEKGDCNIDRRPRRIKEREDAAAGQKLPNLDQIPKSPRRACGSLVEVRVKTRIENARAELLVKAHAGPDQHPRAQPFRTRHHAKQEQRDQRHRQQGQLALADQNAVKNLQHVDGRRQHEQVREKAQNTDDQEFPAESPQGGRQLAAVEKFRSIHGIGSFKPSQARRCWPGGLGLRPAHWPASGPSILHRVAQRPASDRRARPASCLQPPAHWSGAS